MTAPKRIRIVCAVFIVAVLWGLYMQPWKRRQHIAPPPATEEMTATSAVVASVSTLAEQSVALPSASEWPISPFRPSGPREPGMPEVRPNGVLAQPVLQGTMTVRGEKVCVIDGQVHGLGERHGRWLITEIVDNKVSLHGPDQERLILKTR